MAKSIKNIIISVVIIAVLVMGYIYFIKKAPEEATLVSSSGSNLSQTNNTTSSAQDIQTKDFLSVLLNVKSIKLDDSIFSEKAFITLHDSSILLVPEQNPGRPNPFAPIGSDPVSLSTIPVTVSDISSCGTAGSVIFNADKTVNADELTTKAWECFTDKLLICSPSTLNVVSDSETMQYKILSKLNNTCQVSGPKIDFKTKEQTTVTCGLSQKYIDFSYEQSKKLHKDNKFFEGYSATGIITAGGGNINYTDKTTEKITCQ